MRTLVIFQINRLDRKFLKRNLVFFGAEKHIHLVFKALALCGGKIIGEKFTGHAAKAGLRIRNRDSAEEFDDAAGHFVAKAAAPWDFWVIKLTASQNEPVRVFTDKFCTGDNIFDYMLSIAVHRYRSDDVRAVFKNVVKGTF